MEFYFIIKNLFYQNSILELNLNIIQSKDNFKINLINLIILN